MGNPCFKEGRTGMLIGDDEVLQIECLTQCTHSIMILTGMTWVLTNTTGQRFSFPAFIAKRFLRFPIQPPLACDQHFPTRTSNED